MTREEELDAALTEHAKLTAWFNEQKWRPRLHSMDEWRGKLAELEKASAEIRRLAGWDRPPPPPSWLRLLWWAVKDAFLYVFGRR